MSQFRIPLVATYDGRINENASTAKDGRMVNCFPETTSNPVTGQRKANCVKRPGWAVQTTLASGSKGSAIMNWTGQGNGQKVITAFGSTNSTLYDSANPLFVAVSQNGTFECQTSTDAITWTARASATTDPWQKVCYGNGLFVAISNAGAKRFQTSPDGITWTSRTAAEANTMTDIIYGFGVFVAISSDGTNRVQTSTDGVTWTARTAGAQSEWSGITYGNGRFVAVANVGANRVMISTDGITWTAGTSAYTPYRIAYGNGLFVTIAQNGQLATSPDGVTWTERTNPVYVLLTASVNNDMSFGNGQFVANTYNGVYYVLTSRDGITWSARTPSAQLPWNSVEYGQGIYVSVAQAGGPNLVQTSSDGITWTGRTAAVANQWKGLTYGTTSSSLGAITGVATGISETFVSATPTLVVSSSDNTAWYYDTGVGVMTKITDADFPGNASLTLAGTFAHMDGYAFIMTTDGKLWASDLNSVTAWTATSFASANTSPDKGIGCIQHRNTIACFGRDSLEFFYNSGATPFPLSKNISMTQKVGAISADSIVAIGDTLFWAGSPPQGGLSIFSYDSGTNRISTPEIDAALIVVGTDKISLTTLRYFGRSFVQVTAGPTTYVYCVEEKAWFEIETTTQLAYKVAAVQVGGTLSNYAISNVSTAGRVYVMDHEKPVFVDDTVAYAAKVQMPNDDMGTNKRKFYASMTCVCDRSPVASSATLLYSDDDFASEVTAGTFDLTAARPALRRLGKSRRRSWKLIHSTNCAMRIEALEGEVIPGK